jgi:hypothetical protein
VDYLVNAAIPIIAIQLSALEVDGDMTLSATTVLDPAHLRRAEEEPSTPAEPAGAHETARRSGSREILAEVQSTCQLDI